MTTEEATSVATCSNIVSNLLALRDAVRGTSREEAVAIERIVADVMALQMADAQAGRVCVANSRS